MKKNNSPQKERGRRSIRIDLALSLIFSFFLTMSRKLKKLYAVASPYLARIQFGKKSEELTVQQTIVLALDSISSFFSLYGAAYICEEDFTEYSSGFLLKNILVWFLVTVSVFLILNTHKKASTYRLKTDFVPLAIAFTLSTLCYYPFMLLMGHLESFSNTTPVVNLILVLSLVSIPRFLSELKNDDHLFKKISFKKPTVTYPLVQSSSSRFEVLLIGTFSDIESFFKSESSAAYADFTPVAILTPQPADFGLYINDLPVIGDTSALEEILQSHSDFPLFHYIFIVGNAIQENVVVAASEIAKHANIPLMRIIQNGTLEKSA